MSAGACLALGLLLPPAIFFVANFIARSKRGGHECHNFFLGFLAATIITAGITQIIKTSVSYPRPDLYARIARGHASEVKEGRMSYPSGHSSMIFCSMIYSAVYLIGRFRVNLGRGLCSWCLCVLPCVAVASHVATSRIYDYWHHRKF